MRRLFTLAFANAPARREDCNRYVPHPRLSSPVLGRTVRGTRSKLRPLPVEERAMRVPNAEAKVAVQVVIDADIDALRQVPGLLPADLGFSRRRLQA